ncbi:MAG: tetratricopeptide repeat protein [Syntrophales bacterium]|nr:tetratricopeptide repeat protein [Syntrophales bacterium]
MKADFKRNQITTVGQDFSIAQYKANTIRFRQNVGQSRQRNGGSSTFRAAILLMAVFLLLPIQSFAATKVFEREYTYQASEADSKLSCRVIALEQVKRLLLEELGTYLQSISEVKDGVLTKDEIVTLTAGVVRTEVVSEHWDGKVYRLKARIKANPDHVIKAINRLRNDRQKSKDLAESQARAKQYLNDIKRLKQELSKVKGEALKRKQIEYVQAVKNLSAENWFERGLYFCEFQLYNEAIVAFTKTLEITPRYAGAYYNRGTAWAMKGDYDRAIVDFNRALEIDPRCAKAYYNRGIAWADKGDFNRAIADYTKALEIDPRYANAYNTRGYAWGKKGDIDRAIADYTKALEIDPRDAVAYHNRGIAWADKGDFNRAIADYTKVLEIDPRYADAYYNRGNAWGKKGDFNRAIADYTKALEIDPRDANAYNNRGHAWHGKGDYDRAIADYTKALEIDPRYAKAYNNRGNAWGGKGNPDRAIADFNRALEIDPRYAEAYCGRGAAWIMKGDFWQASADARKGLSLKPEDKECQILVDYLKAKVRGKE